MLDIFEITKTNYTNIHKCFLAVHPSRQYTQTACLDQVISKSSMDQVQSHSDGTVLRKFMHESIVNPEEMYTYI